MGNWYDDIILKCPNVFRKNKYIEFNEGWKDLILEASLSIENIIVNKFPKDLIEEIYATQVKEKFGGLRFYMTYYDDDIDAIIKKAETKSTSTCEVCGNLASRKVNGGWIQTLCRTHGEKDEEPEES